MKKLITILMLVFSVFAFGGTAFAESGQVALSFNGKNLPTDVPPVIKSGRTLVPVRVISEALGADVNWDPTLNRITITKNERVLNLTINDTGVLLNGEKAPDLEVPAQIISGRTVVPVRFVGTALGANVGWDDKTRTVALTYAEKRDGMTPEELMLKSNEVMFQKNSYKFKGQADVVINIPGTAPVKTRLQMDGMFKKTGDRAEVYVKQALSTPAVEGSPTINMDVETYTDGAAVYHRINQGPWQKQQLAGDLAALLQNQNPQTALQMTRDFSLIMAHGNETTVNNNEYYTLFVKIDSEKYKSFIKGMLPELSGSIAGGEIDKDQFAKLMDELIGGMNLDLTQKVFIDKKTFVMDKTLVNGKIAFTTGGIKMTEEINMDMDLYDLDKEVTMPKVDLQ